MVGIRPKTESLSIDGVVARARAQDSLPLQAVADLAEAIANRDGGSLVGYGLRLFESLTPRSTDPDLAGDHSPFALGQVFERLLSPDERRRAGVHLTPAHIARRLTQCIPGGLVGDDAFVPRVLDPAVGGGAFLLAAADELTASGASPADVIPRLSGIDIDADAIAVAEAAVGLWAIGQGLEPSDLCGLQVGDGLLVELPVADLVVSNPPFLSQLRSASTNSPERRDALRAKWGDLIGAYTDDAWLFLAAGVAALAENGSLAMVQPMSILGARHAEAIRARVQDRARLGGLWISNDHVFEAAVHVCGVVVAPPTTTGDVQRWTGPDFDTEAPFRRTPRSTSWGPVGVVGRGVPDVDVGTAEPAGSLANFTAGFRDQFYGFAPHVREGAGGPRLITVGMIDPLLLRWGRTSFRFAKSKYTEPVVHLDELEVADPTLAEWVAARTRPKILIATQTRVVEVWVDEVGDTIPATPVISAEPDDPADIWLLAAALSAPPIAAHFVAEKFGTAMALDALKLAARDLAEVPLPQDEAAWRDGADFVQRLHRVEPDAPPEQRVELLRLFAAAMTSAYQIVDSGLVEWWLGRTPQR